MNGYKVEAYHLSKDVPGDSHWPCIHRRVTDDLDQHSTRSNQRGMVNGDDSVSRPSINNENIITKNLILDVTWAKERRNMRCFFIIHSSCLYRYLILHLGSLRVR